MFTGLVLGLGRLARLQADRLAIHCEGESAAGLLPDLAIGDSVAVDGVCLTVTRLLPDGFEADVSPETLRRTTLGQKTSRVQVNLEPSLRVGGKLGGHFVTGHIDGTGQLISATEAASAWELQFAVQATTVQRYLVEKGSIAVNGISLTIAECDLAGQWFSVAVIPHTYAITNLHQLRPGDPVNLEADILGKYVDQLMHPAPGRQDSALTPDFLLEHGYL
jgi:riboflavin synthase